MHFCPQPLLSRIQLCRHHWKPRGLFSPSSSMWQPLTHLKAKSASWGRGVFLVESSGKLVGTYFLANTVGCFISAWKIPFRGTHSVKRAQHHPILFIRSLLGSFFLLRVKCMNQLLIYVHPELEKVVFKWLEFRKMSVKQAFESGASLGQGSHFFLCPLSAWSVGAS